MGFLWDYNMAYGNYFDISTGSVEVLTGLVDHLNYMINGDIMKVIDLL
jgi:hypothetical protein